MKLRLKLRLYLNSPHGDIVRDVEVGMIPSVVVLRTPGVEPPLNLTFTLVSSGTEDGNLNFGVYNQTHALFLTDEPLKPQAVTT